VQVLRYGTKREVAKEFEEIAQQISRNMTAKDGAGNKGYYNSLEAQLLMEYPALNNALMRNNFRRMMKKNVTVEELSEDSDEVEELRPINPEKKRTFTKSHCLVSTCTNVD